MNLRKFYITHSCSSGWIHRNTNIQRFEVELEASGGTLEFYNISISNGKEYINFRINHGLN